VRTSSDASIHVEVADGVARLTGTVPSQSDRLTALTVARSTDGVRSVIGDLTVKARVARQGNEAQSGSRIGLRLHCVSVAGRQKEPVVITRVPEARKRSGSRHSLVIALAFLALSSAPARAALPPSEAPPPAAAEKLLGALGLPDCACEIDVAELQRYRDLVAAATSAEEARALATRPSNLARRALGAAQRLAPWSGSLRDAHGKLLAYEGRVAKAQTPAEAAREFEGLVRLAGSGVILHHPGVGGS
jgi:hypothetical protein